MFRKYPLYKWILFFSDLFVIFLTGIVVNRILELGYLGYFTLPAWLKFCFLFSVSFSVIYIFRKNYLYKLNVVITKNKQLVLLTKSVFFVSFMFLMFSLLLRGGIFEQFRKMAVLYLPVLLLFLIVIRFLLIRTLYKRLLKRGYLKKNVLVIGAGEAGKMLAAQMEVDTDLGLQIVGFIDDDPLKFNTKIFMKPVLGKINDVTKELLTKYNVKRFFIAINFISYERLIAIIKFCRKFGLPISLVSKHFNIIDYKLHVSYFDGVSFATFNYFRAGNLFYLLSKKIIDMSASFLLLILFSPLFLLFALLIKFTSKGPVFYKPLMVGKGGKKFVMYKFRSMYNNSDIRVHKELLKEIIVDGEKKGEKIKNDRRITRIGRFLRKYSIDELPQLINVFLGQMSLVGPRPCIPYELQFYKKWHRLRLSVAPGITGLWQVCGRSSVSFNDMVILDIYYIRNRSFWMDYSILLKTIPAVFFGSGAS